MRALKTAVVATSLLGLTACSTWDKTAICCDGGYEYRHRNQWESEKASADMASRVAALERERQRLADELAAARKDNGTLSGRVTDLEQQLANRDRELAALRASAGDSARLASQLVSAQSDVSGANQRATDLESQLAASKQRVSDLESQLAAAQAQSSSLVAASGEKDQLASDLAAANQRAAALESQLAGMQRTGGERDTLAAELAAANQRAAALESQLGSLQGASSERDQLAADLAAARQRIAELERHMADRDKELAALRGDLSTEMAKLKEAQRGLMRALRPQIDKGAITVDLNNERLLINLASGYLFGSGEDQLKPAGAEALKQVGAILKEFPEYKVSVDGHTDNRPIRSALKMRFPTNKELSEARAANAAQALTEGGLSAAETHGYADTRPVMPNSTDAGRAKNRRVEVRVTV